MHFSFGIEMLDGQQINPFTLLLLGKHIVGFLMGNLDIITMCSHFFLLMVAFYRKNLNPLPSLGTIMDNDPRVGIDSILSSLEVSR